MTFACLYGFLKKQGIHFTREAKQAIRQLTYFVHSDRVYVRNLSNFLTFVQTLRQSYTNTDRLASNWLQTLGAIMHDTAFCRFDYTTYMTICCDMFIKQHCTEDVLGKVSKLQSLRELNVKEFAQHMLDEVFPFSELRLIDFYLLFFKTQTAVQAQDQPTCK